MKRYKGLVAFSSSRVTRVAFSVLPLGTKVLHSVTSVLHTCTVFVPSLTNGTAGDFLEGLSSVDKQIIICHLIAIFKAISCELKMSRRQNYLLSLINTINICFLDNLHVTY